MVLLNTKDISAALEDPNSPEAKNLALILDAPVVAAQHQSEHGRVLLRGHLSGITNNNGHGFGAEYAGLPHQLYPLSMGKGVVPVDVEKTFGSGSPETIPQLVSIASGREDMVEVVRRVLYNL